MKKKKSRQLAGLLPIFSCAGSRYSKLYRDTGHSIGAHGQAGSITILPSSAVTQPRGRARHGRQHGAGAQRHGATRPGHAATRPRHGRPQATIRPGTGPLHCRLGHSVRGLCVQVGPGCAPGAPDSVLTQCTVLSHCLGHCS